MIDVSEFPSRKKDLLVEVFYLGNGTPPFIYGVEGHATLDYLQEIEDMLIMEADPAEFTMFGKGEGEYLFKATHEPADEGMSAYWEMDLVGFEPLPEPDTGQDDRELLPREWHQQQTCDCGGGLGKRCSRFGTPVTQEGIMASIELDTVELDRGDGE